MKRLCNRFCNFMQLCATLLLLPAVALAQDVPVPEPTPPEPAAETNTVPPVLVRNIRVQTIGEERHLEELPEGLLFVDATTGKLCLADENDPHGRFVCLCRDIDWHTFTNTVKFNGHRLEFNQFWSQVAEGGSLLYRFGTNSWLRLVGAASGDFCPFTVDAYDPTNGTMVLTADVTSSPVLQVCTNLLEADAWQTATNAAVTTTTDASTTWTITLLGTPFETYRILATVHLPAGIHAERPLHANQGIVMNGERWDEWPNLSGIASNAAAISGHTGNTNNPHAVTLMQAFDADPSEAYEEFGISVSGGDGISELRGFNHRIGFDGGFIEGDFDFSSRPTFDGDGLATTNEVASVASAVATNAGDIVSVERRLDATIASNSPALTALTNALGQRVSEFETIHLNWNFTNAAAVTTNVHYLDPTTIPTRHLCLYVNASAYSNDQEVCKVYVGNPATGHPYPSKPLTIEIMPFAAYGRTNAVVDIGMGTGMGVTYKPNSAYRKCVFSYWPEVGLWEFECAAISTYPTSFRTSRAQTQTSTVEGFSTVEEWVEWRKQQPW